VIWRWIILRFDFQLINIQVNAKVYAELPNAPTSGAGKLEFEIQLEDVIKSSLSRYEYVSETGEFIMFATMELDVVSVS